MNRSRWAIVGYFTLGSCAWAAFAEPVEKPIDKWEAPPPREETPEAKTLIDRAQQLLDATASDVSEILMDPTFLPVHAWPRFRELIRARARSSSVAMVTAQEPGTRLHVLVRVRNRDGTPVRGAILYLYQTSARGGYGANAAHILANSGDVRHARLFGYATTDQSGDVEIHTIRPGGYPDSDLPQHIHLHVTPVGGRERATELLFDDDPRLTPTARGKAELERAVVCHVNRDSQARESIVAEVVLD